MSLVSYRTDGPVTLITLDDGKANALSPTLQGELRAALDRAEAHGAPVVLTGRPGVFSGGFDLGILQARDAQTVTMLRGGFHLAHRLLSFPHPVVIACPGHAVAMGLFLLLSGDYAIGTRGAYRLVANEVALGMTIPQAACAILANRLTPAALGRAVALAEPFSPDDAVAVGILDRVVEAEELLPTARAVAEATTGLDRAAHAASKLRLRRDVLAAILAGVDSDYPASAPPAPA
jgi:enoyl-CoA hydratase